MTACRSRAQPVARRPARSALAVPHLRRTQLGRRQQRAVSHQSRARPDRPVGRLRSAYPDGLRQRSSTRCGRGRPGRRADLLARRHGGAVRRHSAGADQHVDDHQCHRAMAARPVHRGRRAAGSGSRQAGRHGPERSDQGIPRARHPHLSAPPVAQADRGRDRVHRARDAQMEPDQRVLLSPAGSGRHAGPGARLRARHGDRGARSGARRRSGAARGVPAGGRADQLLRQCRRALRHRDVQAARVRRAVGPDHRRALRRRRPQAAPLPLRRAGQFARADRAAAGEQRLPHPARGARRGAVEAGARAGGAAAGVERGARPAAAVGPAVEPAPAADPGLRDRSARVRRPVRRRARGRGQGPGAGRRSARGARPHRGDRRRARRGRERLHEAAPGRVERAAARRDRRRHAAGGRGQLLHRDGGLTAGRRRGRLPRDRWRGRSRADRARAGPSGDPRRRRRGARARGSEAGGRRRPQRHARHRSSAPAPGSPRASGQRPCARCSATIGRRPG